MSTNSIREDISGWGGIKQNIFENACNDLSDQHSTEYGNPFG